MKQCLFWLVNTLILQPRAVSELAEVDLPASKLFYTLEARDRIEGYQVVHNQIGAGCPACALVASKALLADSIPLLQQGGDLFQSQLRGCF